MNKADYYYKKNLEEIRDFGSVDSFPRPKYKDGTPAHTKFITQVFEKYDISKEEFPIPTIRKTAIKTGIREILWIYQKQSNSLDVAKDMLIGWWEDWNIGDGTIGNRYGHTVRKHRLIDNLLKNLKENPFGRRHIMNMWQYEDLNSSKGLFPCAYETIWSVRSVNGVNYVDMTLVQRSNDYIMAGFINKIQYVALMMMVCGHLGYEVGVFAHMTQNLHVYNRHLEALDEVLSRESLGVQTRLKLKTKKNFYDYTIDDFEVLNLSKIKKLVSPLEIAI